MDINNAEEALIVHFSVFLLHFDGWILPKQQQLQVQRMRTGAHPPKTANSCRREKKTTKKKGGGGKIVNSHQDISFQVNGAHQRRAAFPPAVRGGAPYAAPLYPKFRRIIKCYRDFKQCLCAYYPAGTQLTWNWGLAVRLWNRCLRHHFGSAFIATPCCNHEAGASDFAKNDSYTYYKGVP